MTNDTRLKGKPAEEICTLVLGNALAMLVDEGVPAATMEQALVDAAVGSMIERVGPQAAFGWIRVAVEAALKSDGITPLDVETLAVALIGAANGGPQGIPAALDRLAERERNNTVQTPSVN